jgi:integrase
MKTEINLSEHYRRDLIKLLSTFSIFFGDQKSFKELNREDILSFLDSFRKPESIDQLHKWIGTYNNYRIHLMRFFKWLYYPDVEPGARPKPAAIENIPQLKRKEQSIYKPTDLWTEEDDRLFLKYCPSKCIKCYHAVSRDTSCRPHEILKLRIRDIVFKTSGNYQYAEVLVNGTTGSRHIPLIDCIPYVKDWLDEHPHNGNPSAIFICGIARSLGRTLHETSCNKIYRTHNTQERLFSKFIK